MVDSFKLDSNHINQFYAVTLKSVLEIGVDGDPPLPYVERIGEIGIWDLKVKIGSRISRGGTRVSIGKVLRIFCPEPNKSQKENESLGIPTSEVVGLFLAKEDALAFAKNENLKPGDERCMEETMGVLGAIGKHHPVFSICTVHHPFLGE